MREPLGAEEADAEHQGAQREPHADEERLARPSCGEEKHEAGRDEHAERGRDDEENTQHAHGGGVEERSGAVDDAVGE